MHNTLTAEFVLRHSDVTCDLYSWKPDIILEEKVKR